MGFIGDTAGKVWDGFTKAVGAGLAAVLGALCILTYQQITHPTPPTRLAGISDGDYVSAPKYDSTFTPAYNSTFTDSYIEMFKPGRVEK